MDECDLDLSSEQGDSLAPLDLPWCDDEGVCFEECDECDECDDEGDECDECFDEWDDDDEYDDDELELCDEVGCE